MKPITAAKVPTVLDALQVWIMQRPGLDVRNYYSTWSDRDGRNAYKQEIANISKQKRQAQAALDEARLYKPDGEALTNAFRAFSGRLEWTGCKLTYTAGQYWPTEYRAAAAAVLEDYNHAARPKFAPEPGQHYTSIHQIEAAADRAGSHWFSPSNKRFFKTRLCSEVFHGIGGVYFVSSESDFSGVRAFSVRKFNPETADISTVKDCHHNLARAAALRIAQRLSITPPEEEAKAS